MSPRARLVLRILGPSLMVVGVVLGVLGIINFIDMMGDGPVPAGTPGDQGAFGEQSRGLLASYGLIAGGMLVFFLGVVIAYIGYLKAVAEVFVSETGGAIEYGAHRGGRGLGRGLSEAGTQTVKVRCRACGSLDSEDAKFCSACGQAM